MPWKHMRCDDDRTRAMSYGSKVCILCVHMQALMISIDVPILDHRLCTQAIWQKNCNNCL